MFTVIDTTGKTPYRNNHTNDIITAADIVLGITGENNDYDQALYIMRGMKFGDTFSNNRYGIICYDETP